MQCVRVNAIVEVPIYHAISSLFWTIIFRNRPAIVCFSGYSCFIFAQLRQAKPSQAMAWHFDSFSPTLCYFSAVFVSVFLPSFSLPLLLLFIHTRLTHIYICYFIHIFRFNVAPSPLHQHSLYSSANVRDRFKFSFPMLSLSHSLVLAFPSPYHHSVMPANAEFARHT